MVEGVGLDGLTEAAAPGLIMDEEVAVPAVALASSFRMALSRFRRYDLEIEVRM